MTNYDFNYTTLDERIAQLEERVEDLESERTDLINDLYELGEVQAQIDKIALPKYNLDNYSLEQMKIFLDTADTEEVRVFILQQDLLMVSLLTLP